MMSQRFLSPTELFDYLNSPRSYPEAPFGIPYPSKISEVSPEVPFANYRVRLFPPFLRLRQSVPASFGILDFIFGLSPPATLESIPILISFAVASLRFFPR